MYLMNQICQLLNHDFIAFQFNTVAPPRQSSVHHNRHRRNITTVTLLAFDGQLILFFFFNGKETIENIHNNN